MGARNRERVHKTMQVQTMRQELTILLKSILFVQHFAGSKISFYWIDESAVGMQEVFSILGNLIANRNNSHGLNVQSVLDSVTYTALRTDLADTLDKWAKELERFGAPQRIDVFPYEYEEFENIYGSIYFSELELLAKEALVEDERKGLLIIVLSMLLLGYAVGVESFESKAAFVLSIKDIFTDISEDDLSVAKSLYVKDNDALSLFEPETAMFIHKTLTAAGAVAQTLEREDLEGGKPTRVNMLGKPKKKKKKNLTQKVDKEQLRNLLANR